MRPLASLGWIVAGCVALGCASSSHHVGQGGSAGASGAATAGGSSATGGSHTGGASTGGAATGGAATGGKTGTGGSKATGGCATGGSGTGGASTGGTSSGGTAGTSSGGTGGIAIGGSGGVLGTPGCTPTRATVDYGTAMPPAAQWTNVTHELANMASECGNMGPIFSDPHQDMLLTGVARQGRWASTDGGDSWHKIGAKCSSSVILNRLSQLLFDPENTQRWWDAGIYGWERPWSNGVFVTNDAGFSFQGYFLLSIVASHEDSIGVDFCDPQRRTQLTGVHETKNSVLLSTNAGVNFKQIGSKIPANSFCTMALVLDSQTLLVGCAQSWSGNPGAITRSTDGGNSFVKVSTQGISGIPLWASDGTIYWSAEGGGLMKSTDRGATWTKVADGTKAGQVAPLELPDGRILSMANSTVTVSADKGQTWQNVGSAIPFTPNSLAYSPFRRAFYASYFTCNNNVPTDALARYGWDWTK